MPTARFTPSLFDKLTARTGGGEEAGRPAPRLDRYGERAAREALRRDLHWLFNTPSLASAVDLSAVPEVERSVLNYGVPDLAGRAATRRLLEQRARDLRTAIRTFEPRLDPALLDVDVLPEAERENAVTFVVRGEIRSPVEALPVLYKTDVEVDTGVASVRD